ncbi:MAG: endonuclease/exonuclease/phosphatase family protein [Pseudomonadota bacterium]|nr:endonuclease/exonuclease/phosphatase family protein [Pseudomonadota bacterium]
MRSTTSGITFRLAPAAALLLVTGCVSVPEDLAVRSESGESRALSMTSPGCPDRDSEGSGRPESTASTGRPDSLGEQFTLINWNMLKGRRGGWADDLVTHRGDGDLIVLQEAYLTDELRELLGRDNYRWKLATAFRLKEVDAGVMTASKVAPSGTCAQRSREPILKLPKSMLITEYRVGDGSRTLLVANIHSINFSLGTTAFSEQLRQLARNLSTHRGPVVVSGDFNTWSKARQRALDAALADAALFRIVFDQDKLKTVFGKPLDHVYYRDLDLMEFKAIPVASSDHNPMRVTFRLHPAGPQ